MSSQNDDTSALVFFIIAVSIGISIYIFDSFLVGTTVLISLGIVLWAILSLYKDWDYGNITKGFFFGVIITLIIVSSLVVYFVKDYDDNRISQQLNRVMSMEEKLQAQLQLIQNTKKSYSENIGKLTREIQEEKSRYNIRSYQKMTQRMGNNLALIREQDAYCTKLSEIQTITQRGTEEVMFIKQRLQAVKLMNDVVKSGSTLSKEVNLILDRYTPYSQEYAISASELSFKSPAEIWQKHIR